jgi:hypothetical protein
MTLFYVFVLGLPISDVVLVADSMFHEAVHCPKKGISWVFWGKQLILWFGNGRHQSRPFCQTSRILRGRNNAVILHMIKSRIISWIQGVVASNKRCQDQNAAQEEIDQQPEYRHFYVRSRTGRGIRWRRVSWSMMRFSIKNSLDLTYLH